MARNNDLYGQINFLVPQDALPDVKEHAEEQGLELADYIRQLIERDMKAKAKTIDLTVPGRGRRHKQPA